MSIPIWVTDPTGNDNPFLKIKPTILFVGCEDALYDTAPIPNIIANMRFWWSSDGINWNMAGNEADSLNLLGMETTFLYDNGSWAAIVSYAAGVQRQQVGVYSNDGQNWKIAISPPTGTGHLTVTVSYDSGGNQWDFVWNSQHTFVANNNPPASLFGDSVAAVVPLADPSQTAAAPHNTHYSLPTGWTAIRYGILSFFDSGPSDADVLQYTQTPITTGIVNSGAGWPDATWVTTFTFPHSEVNGGGPLFKMTYAKAGTG